MRTTALAAAFLLSAAPLAAQQAASFPPPVRRSDAEIAAAVDEYMARIVPYGFSGSLLVARDGQVLLEKGYGLADRAASAPYTAATASDVGSITKQFTAAAILKLEMEGKLRVTDPITRFFPDAPADKRGITLHHLLTHSAGLEDGFGDDYEVAARDSLARVILASGLRWAPGTRYAYSNAGYTLLGAIVEMASGRPYEAYLREKLFAPAGMTRTGYSLPRWRPGEVAHGYRGGEDWGTATGKAWAPDGQPWWNLRGNGGIVSTVGDLYRWHRALEGTAILSAEAKEKLFTPHVPEDGGQSHYGYGWAIFTTQRGTKLIAHNGGNGVFFADFRRYVDEGVVILVMSNVAEMNGERAEGQVTRIVFGRPFTQPPAVARASSAELAGLAGTYRLESGATVTVSPGDGGLRVSADGAETFALLTTGARPDPALAALAEKSAEIVRASARGDFSAFVAAVGDAVPAGQAERMQRETMARWRERFGELRTVTPLGGVRRDERVADATLRLEFERGSLLLRWTWEGDALMNVGPVREGPSTLFLREPAGTFASYDLGSGRVGRLRFAGDALAFVTPTGEARAVRTRDAAPRASGVK
jgi:CubicO group peptidase (beta-lactamase class C family)